MASHQHHHPSHLFTVRLWAEAIGDDRQEYRGKVQHVVSGEARHFRDWTILEAFLLEKLDAPQEPPNQTSKNQEENRGNPTCNDDNKRKPHP